MRKRFTVEQRLAAIKDYEAGVRVAEICRKHSGQRTSSTAILQGAAGHFTLSII